MDSIVAPWRIPMIKKNLTFLSKNRKTKIHTVIYLPENKEPKAILQITHGMAEYILRYEPFASRLAEEGYIVAGHDHLGHGGSVNDWSDYGYFSDKPLETLLLDMHQLRVNLARRYPKLPYFMLGHSMGSYLLRAYLSVFGRDLSGAVIMGTGYVHPQMAGFGVALTKGMALFRGWHHRSLLVQGMTYNRSYRSYDITGAKVKKNWLTKDWDIASSYRDDPLCGFLFTLNGHRGLFEAVGTACLPETMEEYPKNLPLLLVSGEKDPVGDLGLGVRKVCEMLKKAGMTNVRMKLYKGDRHEILNEVDREQVIQDILDWMGEIVSERKPL